MLPSAPLYTATRWYSTVCSRKPPTACCASPAVNFSLVGMPEAVVPPDPL